MGRTERGDENGLLQPDVFLRQRLYPQPALRTGRWHRSVNESHEPNTYIDRRYASRSRACSGRSHHFSPPGKYTCGVFLSQRFTFAQYVRLKGGEYESSKGPSGGFHFNTGSKKLLFDSGQFQSLFGRYEPTGNYPMFRLSSREDAEKSGYTRAWRSQVCSGHY
jgi:hypothetical protein